MGFGSLIKRKINSIIRRFSVPRLNQNTDFSSNYIFQDQLIECKWKLSKPDRVSLMSNDNLRLSVRLYDVSHAAEAQEVTCIMKEIDINKLESQCLIDPPVSNGTLLLELGCREKYGEWMLFATSTLLLNNNSIFNRAFFPDDSCFYSSSKNSINRKDDAFHESVYQLSKPSYNGASEELQSK